MLTPEYLLRISEGAEAIADELHVAIMNRIIERIMLRLMRGEEYILTAADKWQIETLQEAGFLIEEIQKEIADKTKLQQTEIKAAFEHAGVTTLVYDDTIYQKAGLSPIPLRQDPYLTRLMQRDYEATLGEWTNFTGTLPKAGQDAYVKAVDTAYHLTTSGAVSYTEAVKEAVKEAAKSGVKVRYDSGHEDTIETATLRAVRTGVAQMAGHVQVARMKEMGQNLVVTSSHLGARPTHEVWQGKVFSVDWKTMNRLYPLMQIPTPTTSVKSEYPDFIKETGYGEVDGLCGCNCRHSFYPFFEGDHNPFEQFDSEENKERYALEQKQRAMERRIRKTKRELVNMKAALDACTDEQARFALDLEYQKVASRLRSQNNSYKLFCAQHNLKELSDRLSIAEWNRAQASAANGAATRHANSKK